MFLEGRGPLGAPSSYHPILSSYHSILYVRKAEREAGGQKGDWKELVQYLLLCSLTKGGKGKNLLFRSWGFTFFGPVLCASWRSVGKYTQPLTIKQKVENNRKALIINSGAHIFSCIHSLLVFLDKGLKRNVALPYSTLWSICLHTLCRALI